jgi:hypothetical protein
MLIEGGFGRAAKRKTESGEGWWESLGIIGLWSAMAGVCCSRVDCPALRSAGTDLTC